MLLPTAATLLLLRAPPQPRLCAVPRMGVLDDVSDWWKSITEIEDVLSPEAAAACACARLATAKFAAR